MNDVLQYKEYWGSAQFSATDQIFHGKILGIDDLVNYEGDTVKKLIRAFHEAVEYYLETCAEIEKKPGKTYKGIFNVRISSELHKNASMFAAEQNTTLNDFVKVAIEYSLDHKDAIRKKIAKQSGY